jgi:hypothetical protein
VDSDPGWESRPAKRDHTRKRRREGDDVWRKEDREVAGVEKGKRIGEKGKRVGGQKGRKTRVYFLLHHDSTDLIYCCGLSHKSTLIFGLASTYYLQHPGACGREMMPILCSQMWPGRFRVITHIQQWWKCSCGLL